MAAFLLAPENIVFVSALLLMLLIGGVQALGFAGDADLDLDSDADLLGWLGFGRLPLLALVALFLTLFAIIGLLGQQAAHDLLGAMLSPWIAVPAAGVAALPATGVAARIVAPLLPQDHTTAIPLDHLVGSHARIVTGRAASGSPARARVEDHHGQTHYVMVEPDNPGQVLEEGEIILLVRRDEHLFRAISHGDHYLPRI
ncbi:YqiJ family protein [Sphingobium sp.]|uniref:YqiJ family protein n=1 Tax=Sphingobium sp. TaxID=1912891 RepID=UPI002BA04C4C|nr:YqiJ family protein [Sphingobium sp.]HUD95787.1 YqiJ family protein [Sphingobium sp.]